MVSTLLVIVAPKREQGVCATILMQNAPRGLSLKGFETLEMALPLLSAGKVTLVLLDLGLLLGASQGVRQILFLHCPFSIIMGPYSMDLDSSLNLVSMPHFFYPLDPDEVHARTRLAVEGGEIFYPIQLQLALANLNETIGKQRRVLLPGSDIEKKIQVKEIFSIESKGQSSLLYLGNGLMVNCSKGMSELGALLKGEHFMRVNADGMVNLLQVIQYSVWLGRKLKTKDGRSFRVSRKRIEEVKSELKKIKG